MFGLTTHDLYVFAIGFVVGTAIINLCRIIRWVTGLGGKGGDEEDGTSMDVGNVI